MTEPQFGGTYSEILAFARHAEKLGLVSFARSDHLAWHGAAQPATDPFATLAGLARETDSIRICVLVTPVTLRHPAVIAKNAATIDQMSGGRLDLGVGTGWNKEEHEILGVDFPGPGERWARFEDALDYLDAAFADPSPAHRGKYFSLSTDVQPKPEGIRMIIGGSGPKRTPTLAGQRADEYNLFIEEPSVLRPRIEVMRHAAAGREVEVTAMGRLNLTSPQSAGEQVAAMEEVGIERIYLQWLDLSDFEGMARMLDTVLTI